MFCAERAEEGRAIAVGYRASRFRWSQLCRGSPLVYTGESAFGNCRVPHFTLKFVRSLRTLHTRAWSLIPSMADSELEPDIDLSIQAPAPEGKGLRPSQDTERISQHRTPHALMYPQQH